VTAKLKDVISGGRVLATAQYTLKSCLSIAALIDKAKDASDKDKKEIQVAWWHRKHAGASYENQTLAITTTPYSNYAC